ncbi:MAG: bifunctional adenosylcobinamide kinase/adenosylcobinamide-phosphate guanylyltransferase [Clostridia bacterium]|nr:bifunctional adenosylcobinamide kinase/adenosylcobinamide-phosphate guanylyltransferase [Clostridia bacterium]
MDLIIGGAYQGKRAYAKEKYALTDAQIASCTERGDLPLGARCIDHLELYTLRCVKDGVNATEVFRAHAKEWENSVLICEDIFCGVVPMGAEMRAWREVTGELCAYLSREAVHVTRMFCGLAQVLK